jgi:hypothetical protein
MGYGLWIWCWMNYGRIWLTGHGFMDIFEGWRIECNIDFVDSRMATYFPI